MCTETAGSRQLLFSAQPKGCTQKVLIIVHEILRRSLLAGFSTLKFFSHTFSVEKIREFINKLQCTTLCAGCTIPDAVFRAYLSESGAYLSF